MFGKIGDETKRWFLMDEIIIIAAMLTAGFMLGFFANTFINDVTSDYDLLVQEIDFNHSVESAFLEGYNAGQLDFVSGYSSKLLTEGIVSIPVIEEGNVLQVEVVTGPFCKAYCDQFSTVSQ